MLSEDIPYAEASAFTMSLREMMETYGSDVWNYAYFLEIESKRMILAKKCF